MENNRVAGSKRFLQWYPANKVFREIIALNKMKTSKLEPPIPTPQRYVFRKLSPSIIPWKPWPQENAVDSNAWFTLNFVPQNKDVSYVCKKIKK